MKKLLTYFLLFLFVLAMLLPIMWTLSTSLSDDITTVKFKILPSHITLKNYIKAWNYPRSFEKNITMGTFFLNSLIVSIGITILSIISDALAGYILARKKFKGRELIFFLSLTTMMVPFYVTSIPMFLIVRELGWINSFFGLIVPFIGSGFGIYMFRQAFLSIPKEIEESAKLDGLSDLGIFLRIMFPLVKPTTATMIIFKSMWSWNIFYWPLLIINSTEKYTLPLGLTLFRGMNITRWGLLTAGLMIAIIPIIIIFLLMQKNFIKGLTGGAVKG